MQISTPEMVSQSSGQAEKLFQVPKSAPPHLPRRLCGRRSIEVVDVEPTASTAKLRRVPGTWLVARARRLVRRIIGQDVATVAFLTILHSPVGVLRAVSGALLECHVVGARAIKLCRRQGAKAVSSIIITPLVSVVANHRWCCGYD